MASSSSCATMASPGTIANNYDVFLSFRGLDTRQTFTDHLYEKLVQAGIRTFRDDDEIEIGAELKPEIEKAIKASEASIIVLSENYATSTWCLDELWLILEQKREFNQFVLPIFYHVDPSHVRKHEKSFEIKSNISARWTNDNVKRWKEALTEVAGLKSEVASGPETEFIRDIVDKIYNRLDRNQVYLPSNLIGMNTRDKEIDSWLKQPDAAFFVICGMGGSGKSTLAKHIVYSNWQKFERISIIEDIGSRYKKPHDLLQLQEKLFRDILGGKKKKIPSVCQGTYKIEEVLKTKKALIVLDDIAELDHLVTLLGTGDINKESKIIITTRLDDTRRWFESRSWRCQEHKVKLLYHYEALELLSLHAFGSKFLQEGYEELAEYVVQYCGGNPLALEVLGSSLSEDISIPSWKSALNLLKKGDIHQRIYHVLLRSYDLLPFDTDRELFLHVACFFVGKDMDYVIKVLEPDYAAVSRIKTLMKRCLLYISPNKKLMMHPLLQEVGRNIVNQESPIPAKRSRVWRNKDSYELLKTTKGSKTMKGLALDMQILRKEEMYSFKSQLKADSLKKMDNLKLLCLDFVELSGSYENFSEDLRWLSWLGFHLRSIPSELFMGNMVALDMSYSCLAVFEPPLVLQSLKILNLKDSRSLFEIRNISRLPNLESLILWNCRSLVHVCETIGGLKSLVLLNMTGCENLFKYSWKRKSINPLARIKASLIGQGSIQQSSFSLPHSLERLFLKDCNLDSSYFSLSFKSQSSLQYLNLGNSLFECLPAYNHLKSLRVLDLTFCSKLKWLLRLPSTLAELYIYYCESLEKVTFESSRFTLQELGYEGCINLCEIEGFIKLVPLLKLDEIYLGNMKWLKKYQNHEVCLVGDDEFTIGRRWSLQMLFEFNIMSISLPDIKDSNLIPHYKSVSPSLSFDVPLCPKDRKLIGLSVTLKYTISGEDWVWFTKISTTSGVDLMYNPRVVGKPLSGEVCIWLSYWPIGNHLEFGDKVNVSFFVMNGLKIHECGASLVYIDDVMNEYENMQNNMNRVREDLSSFQLSTGAYYLCRRDFYELTEVGRLTPGWFKTLVGSGNVNDTEIRGWRKTGRPMQPNESFTELKMVRCIINGPDSDEVYKITKMSKSSIATKTVGFISRIIGETERLTSHSQYNPLKMKSSEASEVTTEVVEAQMVKNGKKMVKGRVVFEKKNISYINKAVASVLDRMYKFFGQNISFQLISATHPDLISSGGLRGKLGNPAILDDSITTDTLGILTCVVNFEWNEELGVPGAILVKNNHHSEFFFKSLTLEDIPGIGQLHFVCNSWVYPSKRYTKNRVFFVNKAYLPSETPELLLPYRLEELAMLRGNGSGELHEWDRVYDYAFYNDLGNPDHDLNDARPVLGGSSEYPYPRRMRTGRPPTKSDPQTESRLPLIKSLNIYVPRDERYGDLTLPDFPMPQVIEGDKSAWRTDEEFAREMLAGVNPVSIRLLKEFPPTSMLDFEVYGNQNSSIKSSHIEANLDGLYIQEAIMSNKLFILDYHDLVMPFVRRINATSTKIYATRTLLFLQKDGTLKPLAIELSLPQPEGDHFGAISKVFTPAEDGVKGSIWQLAKAYVAVNDSGIHQLISHWLNTHCVEPFVIATNRQLSVLHPVHKLLQPHFRGTMSINALGRQILINSGGILEQTVFPGKYAMEMSSMIYKDWVFPEQALPSDLLKRGMAIVDSNSPHGLHLLIEDYPYAVDGLEIWLAIQTWVDNYCSFYYRSDDVVQSDIELQSWWRELQLVGHGDKKDEPWWPIMLTCHDLINICTIIIWVSSALHAAVNFGQYSNAGYLPNRPTLSHQLMPEPNTPEYDELEENPDSVFKKTITALPQACMGVSIIEHLSREVYLWHIEFPEFIIDSDPLKAFQEFGKKLLEIEMRIIPRNYNEILKNRVRHQKGDTSTPAIKGTYKPFVAGYPEN